MLRWKKYVVIGSMSCCLLLSVFSWAGAVETPNNGRYYFNQLKNSIISVLQQHQGLINMNPDGTVKNRDLLPKVFFNRAYAQFKKIGVGQDFRMADFANEKNPEVIAPILTTLLQAGRIVTAKSQKIINAEVDGTSKMKKFIPAVFGKLTLVKFTLITDSYMKQTTLGKGQYKQRNYDNRPNLWEIRALTKFNQPDWPLNFGYGEYVRGSYHFVKPIYIKKGCLPCHGQPIGEEGPYGHPKEGYDEGDVRGGISVALPVQ